MPLTTKFKLDEASYKILEQRLLKNGAKPVVIDDNIYVEVSTKKELLKVETCKPLMKLIDYLQQIQNWDQLFDHDSKHEDPSFTNLVISYLQIKTKIYEEKLEALTKKLSEVQVVDTKSQDDKWKDLINVLNEQTNIIKNQHDKIESLTQKLNTYDSKFDTLSEKVRSQEEKLDKKKSRTSLDEEIFKVVSIENYVA
jgi:uncharacterized coiled-coil protein SlyX